MAVALQQPKPMTYDDYLAEGEVEGRYDIIDGVRYFMTGATRRHNRISYRLASALVAFEEAENLGKCYLAPTDILISRIPLRTRQPDVFFMSFERLAHNAPEDSPMPLGIGPELAIEVLSPSDNRRALSEKLADYAKLEVNECWLVSGEDLTIQVLRLSDGIYSIVHIYQAHDVVQSVVFPSLRVPLSAIFAA